MGLLDDIRQWRREANFENIATKYETNDEKGLSGEPLSNAEFQDLDQRFGELSKSRKSEALDNLMKQDPSLARTLQHGGSYETYCADKAVMK